MLKITTAAVEQLKEVLRQENREEIYIRIFISGVG
jgi:Fe-S cluster assembly iron-binding protein IscA